MVGAGPSGQQIADELARAGRDVHIAVGRHKSLPRRYRGRDAYWWMDRMGMLDRTVDSLPQHRAGLRTPERSADRRHRATSTCTDSSATASCRTATSPTSGAAC